MAQDRLTEGGRSIVWTAVMGSLNAHRRDGALARGLFLKFERWGSSEAWEPGMPDSPAIEESDIQQLVADIAADVCKRVEAALDQIDPREAPKPERSLTAAEQWKQRVEKYGPEATKAAEGLHTPECTAQAKWTGVHECICGLRGIVPAEDLPGFVGPPEPVVEREIDMEVYRASEGRLAPVIRENVVGVDPGFEEPVVIAPDQLPVLRTVMLDHDPSTTLGRPNDPEAPLDREERKLDFRALEAPVAPRPTYPIQDVKPWVGVDMATSPEDWVVWKKRVIGDRVEWMTRDPEYVFASRELAERKAESFKRQLSVVDVMVLPVGEKPVEEGEKSSYPVLDREPLVDQVEDLREGFTSGGGTVLQPSSPVDTDTPGERIDELRAALEAGALPLGPISQVPKSGMYMGRPPRTYEEMARDETVEGPGDSGDAATVDDPSPVGPGGSEDHAEGSGQLGADDSGGD